ncbi:MAG: hypothetical protein AAGM67_19540, partial [Bacteroidota bacterium]
MKSTQLYRLLAPLSEANQEDLLKWMDWRIGRMDGNLLAMLKQLLEDPDPQKVWAKVIEDKAYPKVDAKGQIPNELRKKMTALKKLVEEYFASVALR